MKRVLAVILMLGMLLTGCGASPARKEKKSSAKPGVYAAAAGLDPTAELLRVDGRSVTAGQYLYWLADACGRIEKYYGGKADWAAQRNGRTLSQCASDQALDAVKFYAEVRIWAKRYGCKLTAADRTAAAEKAKRRGAALKLEESTAYQFCEDYCLYGKLYREFCTKGSRLYPAQAALNKFASDKKLTAQNVWPAYFDALLEQAAGGASVQKSAAYQKLNAEKFYQKLSAARTKTARAASQKKKKQPQKKGGGARTVLGKMLNSVAVLIKN